MSGQEMPAREELVGVSPQRATGALHATTPLAATLGLEVLEVTPQRVQLVLPNLPGSRNHVAGPHAGAIFTAGETAAGLLAVANFGEWLDRKVGLAVRGQIEWLKLARTAVIVSAVLDVDPADVRRLLDAGERPQWATAITCTRGEDEAVCATMSVELTLVDRRPTPADVPSV